MIMGAQTDMPKENIMERISEVCRGMELKKIILSGLWGRNKT